MKTLQLLLFTAGVLITEAGYTQTYRVIPLSDLLSVRPVGVQLSTEIYLGKKSICVTGSRTGYASEVQYAKVLDLPFRNGVIEVQVAGVPSSGISDQARGFVGIAFRIDDRDSSFECIYLRPTNSRADDQVRRNHSVQYISHPGHPWHKLRSESPSKYEAYADMELGEWTRMRIDVQGERARLYVNGVEQPQLIVNDLKLGAGRTGSIGLWIGPGTIAHFADLTVITD